MMNDEGRMPSERGSILLYVVWVMTLLSLLAAGIGSQALFALDFSERLSDQLRASYVARGAIQQIAAVLRNDHTPSVDAFNDRWASLSYQDEPLAGGTFSVTALDDEERRINLNTASAEVLARLLETTGGLSERDAAEAAAAIEDWRDEDDTERRGGAEGSYYRSLRDAYDAHDGPFEQIEELRLVRGISPEVYDRVEPHVTVFGSGRINLNTAPARVLRALGLSEAGSSGVVAFRAGEDNQERTADDRVLSSVIGLASDLTAYVPAEDIAPLTSQELQQMLAVHSTAFRVSLEARVATPESRMSVVCVLDRQGRVTLWAER